MTPAVDRIEQYEYTVAALTPKTAPTHETTYFNPGEVVWVEIIIPDGPAGYSGVRLTTDSRQLVPNNTGQWLIGNNEVITHEVYNWPNSGHFGIEAYNEDDNPHTYTVRYGVREIQVSAPSAPTVSGTTPITPSEGVAVTPGPPEVPTTPTELTPEAPSAPPPTSEPPPVSAPPEAPPPTPAPPEAPVAPPVSEPAPPIAPPITEPAPAEPPLATFPGEPNEGIPEGPTEGVREGPPEVIGAVAQPRTAGRRARGRRTVVRVKTERVTLPAGGWLPAGARYTVERTDQGQDGITNWRGPIIAPGSGYVVHNLSDKPFPAGFGPHYVVVHINDGRFGGRDWYVGHATSDMRAGEHFNAGRVLAHADQGLRQGGGWFEIGEAPGGVPGPMGQGARFAHLFSALHVVHRHRVTEHVGARPPRRRPGPSHRPIVRRRPPPNRGAAPRRAGAPRRPPGAPRRLPGRPAPRRAPAVRGRVPARGRPAPRRAPAAPPPPPPPRAPAARRPRPRRRRRR